MSCVEKTRRHMNLATYSNMLKFNIKRSMECSAEDKREKIQALSQAKEGYSMKLDLLTNATAVDDAIRFVSDRSRDKENLTSSTGNSNEDDTEESNNPDYDEADEDRLEVEQEITMTVINLNGIC